ncbi:uncharacterized protein [Phyllobates terribilis]|uniref:uncharacterized protein n=1 Tax=Phyllobates terribilis TaxID=111132 RepID=UPI003CCAA140
MGDSSVTPLLLDDNEKKQPRSLDARIEECISQFGWAQLIQSVLVSLSWAFDAQQCFISVFTDTLTDWSLQNSSPFLTGLPASSFFIGCVAGGLLLTPLADSCLGRKNLLILSCLLMSLSGLLTASLATDVFTYSLLRFASGFGRASIGTCALVLSGELVGSRFRSHVGIIGFVFFALGFASLPGIAYLNRHSSWRCLYMWTSLPALLYTLTLYFFARESPRWLFVRGSREEAVKTINSISSLPDPNSLITLSFYTLDTTTALTSDVYSAIRILVSRKWSSCRLLLIMTITFGLGVVYYGMPLGLGNLSFNLYISVAMNAFMELPASLATFFLIGTIDRKSSLLMTTTISGVCSIFCGAFTGSKTMQVALELVSFMSGTTALDIALIYTMELFPTCVRNSALSMVRLALVFGGAFGPVLAAAGRQNELVTYGIFGAVVLVTGVFVVWLPETRGSELCDTMEEEDCKRMSVGFLCGRPYKTTYINDNYCKRSYVKQEITNQIVIGRHVAS